MPRKAVAAIVLACLMPLALPAQERHPAARATRKSTARIAQLATPATVTIVTLGVDGDTLGQGSGFVVRSDGVVVTNWHVLVGAANAVVVMNNGERYERVRFVDGDSSADIALLRVPGFDLPVIPARSQAPSPGERVVVLGSPMGLSRTVTDGIVSATRVVAGRQLIQITAAISPGSSGGPVMDASGRVFAISTFYLEGGQQLNFAVPVRYALGLLLSPARERSISEVFGVGASPSVATSAAPGVPAPARARETRASVQGTYHFTQTAADSTGSPVLSEGWILSAEERAGLVAQAFLGPSGKASDDWYVYGISDLRTGADGQVVLDFGGQVYQGYQTDDGLFLHSQGKAFEFTLLARSQGIPLSANSGLYSVQARTHFRMADGTQSSTPDDWTGAAAVVTTADSIFVDIMIHHPSGGSVEMYARARLYPDGRFSLRTGDPAPTFLDGSIRAGRFSGQWTDSRSDGSSFAGQVNGVR